MAEERRKTISSGVLWTFAAIALVVIFFGVRHLTRDKLPLRVAEAQVQDLIKPSSTSGGSSRSTSLKRMLQKPRPSRTYTSTWANRCGRVSCWFRSMTPSAQARLATAIAALRTAESATQSVEGGGSHQEQLALSSNIAKAQLDHDQATRDLDVIKKLEAKGAAAPSEEAQAQTRLQIATASLQSLEEQKTKPYAPTDLTRAHSSVAEAQAAVTAANQVIAQSNVRTLPSPARFIRSP
jgi:HlyD family secretion protein